MLNHCHAWVHRYTYCGLGMRLGKLDRNDLACHIVRTLGVEAGILIEVLRMLNRAQPLEIALFFAWAVRTVPHLDSLPVMDYQAGMAVSAHASSANQVSESVDN